MYVDDVNQIVGDLRYDKINLIGISYGTAVEQVFLRRYPYAVCRSGPGLPPDASAGRGAHSLTFPPFSRGEATV